MLHSAPPALTTAAVAEFLPPASGQALPVGSIHTFEPTRGDTSQPRPVLESHPSEVQGCEAVQCGAFVVSFDTLIAIHYIRTDVFYDLNVPGFANYFANGLLSHNCGLGKSVCELVWGENVVRRTNGKVLLLTPLAVGSQMVREAEKFGIEAEKSAGGPTKARIVVTNYEKLHLFDPSDYDGVICDESSILKGFGGATRKALTRFMAKRPYRLLATATPSPNDYVELGTSSEALGGLSHSEMLKRFFQQLDDKGQKKETRLQEQAEKIIADDPSYYKKLAYRVAQTIGQWRLKHHAVVPFWRWVASWAIACRMPSDLGFDDADFILPPLVEHEHVIVPKTPPDGMLFTMPAFGLGAERDERMRTLDERCEFVADLVNHDRPAIVWCHLNAEGDRLEEVIPDAKQICGSMSDDQKCERFEAFIDGQLRVLVLKPKIGAWGLNLQHCNHVVTFASHSYEQHKQSVARCHRFGQKLPVRLDRIATQGEVRSLGNLRRKQERAEKMFEAMIREMHDATRIDANDEYTKKMIAPAWLTPANGGV